MELRFAILKKIYCFEAYELLVDLFVESASTGQDDVYIRFQAHSLSVCGRAFVAGLIALLVPGPVLFDRQKPGLGILTEDSSRQAHSVRTP